MQVVWSVKGGVGVTVVAAALAAGRARRHRSRAVLVDLCGDAPAVLGQAEPGGPGVRDWLAAADSTPEALGRLVVPVAEGLSLLPCGAATTWPRSRSRELAEALDALADHVVVDGGRCGGPCTAADHADLVDALARRGDSLLVTRSCYLALRRALVAGAVADGIVLVSEAGRCLDRRAVSDVLGLPVVAEVEWDPSLARSVDAGMLVRRSHRQLDRSLRELW